MEDIKWMIQFFQELPRQGPGDRKETLRAFRATGMDATKQCSIADIGCGTGASTIPLAENSIGHITAADLFPEFLLRLRNNADRRGLLDRITTFEASMDSLPFNDEAFDLIWSEGAIYIMGFEAGIRSWKRLIKKGGYLVVSEASWFTPTRPAEIEDYWRTEYQEMDTEANKVSLLEQNGYTLIESFRLPEYCWLANYYGPIREYIPEFLKQHHDNEEVRRLANELTHEMEIYEKYKAYYGYTFYIAQKIG